MEYNQCNACTIYYQRTAGKPKLLKTTVGSSNFEPVFRSQNARPFQGHQRDSEARSTRARMILRANVVAHLTNGLGVQCMVRRRLAIIVVHSYYQSFRFPNGLQEIILLKDARVRSKC